jgi:hypothetical protein
MDLRNMTIADLAESVFDALAAHTGPGKLCLMGTDRESLRVDGWIDIPALAGELIKAANSRAALSADPLAR